MGWIVYFGIIFMLAFIIPMLAGVPTYITFGSIYLRFNSLPELTPWFITVIGIGVAIATYLVSFSVVNINSIVKSERTMLNIPTEMVKSIGTYSLRLFWVYIILLLLLWIGQVLFQPTNYASLAIPIYNFVMMLMFLFVPSAIVMEEMSVANAIKRSIEFIRRFPIHTLFYLGVITILITVADAVLLLIPFYPQYLVMITNVLFILPFTIILAAHMFISKYSIIG
jgi:hypothetical protein